MVGVVVLVSTMSLNIMVAVFHSCSPFVLMGAEIRARVSESLRCMLCGNWGLGVFMMKEEGVDFTLVEIRFC